MPGDFPEDLPMILHYRIGFSSLYVLPRRRDHPQQVPSDANAWRVWGEWLPLEQLPKHWIPFLNRPVIQEDSNHDSDGGPERWKWWYWKARKSDNNYTFRQAMFWFHKENGYWPRKQWPYMPREVVDEFRRVSDVPPERLVPEGVRA